MRKFLCFFIALVLMMGMSGNVFADITTSGGTGSSDVLLTEDATTFSVTVPVQLPVSVAADGSVTVADNAKIVNNSYGSVKVANVQITPVGSWSVVSYDTDMSGVKVGAKELGFTINTCKTQNDGSFSFDAAQFPVLDGANATDSDELALVYSAKVPAQKTAIAAGTTIATAVFTVGWNE